MTISVGRVSLTNYMPVTPLSDQHATTYLTWLISTYITTIPGGGGGWVSEAEIRLRLGSAKLADWNLN